MTRTKAELTEEAQAEIELVLQEMRSDEAQVRKEATEKARRLKALYGTEALQFVEQQLAERFWTEFDQGEDPSVIYE